MKGTRPHCQISSYFQILDSDSIDDVITDGARWTMDDGRWTTTSHITILLESIYRAITATL
jgi:hypothetical protein